MLDVAFDPELHHAGPVVSTAKKRSVAYAAIWLAGMTGGVC